MSGGTSGGMGVFGFGPLDRWLDDDQVAEVLVNAGGEVWIERRDGGGPQPAGNLAPGMVLGVVERILAPIGRRLDRASPMVDARLPDGSRVCAVMPPVAVDGVCLAVRRFTHRPLGLHHFAPPEVVALLDELVRRRCNVVVSGATSSGKTTLLAALVARADRAERILTLEDVAELHLDAPHVLRLETRSATPDGPPAVTMTHLVRTALRLRPDRLVVGEIRGDEAIDLLQALNTGHDGSLATVHANSPLDALARLESLIVQAAAGWPLAAVRQQVHRSVDAVVQVQRDASGARRVVEVAEVVDALLLGDSPGAAARIRTLADADGRRAHLTRGRR